MIMGTMSVNLNWEERQVDTMTEKLSNEIRLIVWQRDHWICTYCGNPVFFMPALKLFNKMSPGHGYYHPHGKKDEILSLFQWSWASVDHVEPKSKGGADSLENYVTACWKCNLHHGNRTKQQGKPEPILPEKFDTILSWDGFVSLYPILAKREDEWTRLIRKHIG